jgi:hypothetical protein
LVQPAEGLVPLKTVVSKASVAARAAADGALPQADKQRGLWNFLTWPFFLAEIMAADLFFGKGAHAAEELDFASRPTEDQADLELDQSRNFGTQKAADPEPDETGLLDYGDGTAADHSLSGISKADLLQGTSSPSGKAQVGGGASGGNSGSSVASSGPGDASDLLSNELSPNFEGSLLSLSFDGNDANLQLKVAELLDLGLDLSLPDIGFSLDLGPLSSTAETAVGLDAEFGEGISVNVAVDGLPALAGDVLFGGAITFSEPESSQPVRLDELFIGGRYTDYHVALQLDSQAGSDNGAAADLSTQAEDSLTNSSFFSGDNGLNDSLVILPSADDELESRGFTI